MRRLPLLALLVGCLGCGSGAKVRVELPEEGAPAAGAKEEKKGPVKADMAEEGSEGPGGQFISLALPSRPALAAPKPVRVKSEDVTIPPLLPPTAAPRPDRVPVDDPTEALSAAAALRAAVTSRTAPAPYLRLALPDPFEHRRPLTLGPPAEATTPQVEAPPPPR
jgi:hypothetical protein